MTEMSKRIAIIGAGASGLAAARHCSSPQYGFICEVYEQTNHMGGIWIYTDDVDFDANGLPIHTSMYKGLRTNLPKEVMNFPDFNFSEKGKSYLDQQDVLEYLHNYAKHYKLEQYIKFHHKVIEVSPIEETRWSVTTKDLLTHQEITKSFDAILICNGHYSKPNMPNIPGKHLFAGTQIHSYKYRSSEWFKGQSVLVIGAGPSGIDIALHLSKDASKVFLSHRRDKIATDKVIFPKNVEQVLNTIKITKNGIILADNKFISVNSIIYCTGYKYYYPFLSSDCSIKVEDNFVQPLYKHLIHIEKPTMGFVGIPFQICPFLLFDFQVRFFLKSIQGAIQLPSKTEMMLDVENDMKSRLEKGFPQKHAHRLGKSFQEQYFADLARIGKMQPVSRAILKLYEAVSGKYQRELRFEIVDEENFVQLGLSL